MGCLARPSALSLHPHLATPTASMALRTRGRGSGLSRAPDPPVSRRPGWKRKHRPVPGVAHGQSVHRAGPSASHFRRLVPNKTAARKLLPIPRRVSGPRWRRGPEPTPPRNRRRGRSAVCPRLAPATRVGQRAGLPVRGPCPPAQRGPRDHGRQRCCVPRSILGKGVCLPRTPRRGRGSCLLGSRRWT